MKKEEIESWGKSLKKRPFYTVILIIIVLVIFIGVMFFSGYFSEKGRRIAAPNNHKTGEETTELTRDQNKIYQNDNSVGDVIGEVEEKGDVVIFKQLNNTENLNQNIPFEYKKHTYQILRIETQIGMKIDMKIGMTNSVMDSGVGVLENVICRKIN